MRPLDEMPKRVRELYDSWINGNRKDVANELLKARMPTYRFFLSLLDAEDLRVLTYLVQNARETAKRDRKAL